MKTVQQAADRLSRAENAYETMRSHTEGWRLTLDLGVTFDWAYGSSFAAHKILVAAVRKRVSEDIHQHIRAVLEDAWQEVLSARQEMHDALEQARA